LLPESRRIQLGPVYLDSQYLLIMGVTLVYGVIVMVFNTLVDVAYALLDPRVELR
jgi:oligopeptide transport system permease protein